ncbi:hypothetical protein BCR39DRAFT_587988 [Naematelia encephala]|uniref:Zn(2)-C6 fungal-type domain-containing protein n=1 Tax=Naematelia encephala TaxID=71784 RepID=A0A1Y2B5T8_9TREE|nr:hypothetical protein BCR39DRAFT_587988 [Naematelia encephala]
MMTRGFSDTAAAYAPRQPSRLNPASVRLSISNAAQQRGTVSMPTSPLLSHQRDAMWQEGPRSAQAFFGLSEASLPNPDQFHQDQHQQQPSWTAQHYQPALPQTHEFELEDSPPEQEVPRKKRAQVRIACTHCQKACKRCSNTRPCERCLKYGLKDCVDSTRKPRKTGVKRGPYKRRDVRYDSPPLHTGYNDPYPPSSASGTYQPTATYGSEHSLTPLSPRPPQPPQPQSQSQQPLSIPTDDIGLGLGLGLGLYPPGPLQHALSAALSGPRWVHGQRLPPDSEIAMGTGTSGGSGTGGDGSASPGVLYPPTPGGPFPISLNTGIADPFSRAVSPIRAKLELDLHRAADSIYQLHHSGDSIHSAPHHDAHSPHTHNHTLLSNINSPNDITTIEQWDNHSDISVEQWDNTNNNNSRTVEQWNINNSGNANVNVNVNVDQWDNNNINVNFTDPFPASPHDHNPAVPSPSRPGTTAPGPLYSSTTPTTAPPIPLPPVHSPAMIALKRIRKPSLKTLMAPGSRAGSPGPSSSTSAISLSSAVFGQGHETGEQLVSPMLFNQPMSLDDEAENGSWDDSSALRLTPSTGGQIGDAPAVVTMEEMGGVQFDGMMPFPS